VRVVYLFAREAMNSSSALNFWRPFTNAVLDSSFCSGLSFAAASSISARLLIFGVTTKAVSAGYTRQARSYSSTSLLSFSCRLPLITHPVALRRIFFEQSSSEELRIALELATVLKADVSNNEGIDH